MRWTTCREKHIRFQSTPSAWRVTRGCRPNAQANEISIHTLRMEGDTSRRRWDCSPRRFQSTPSAWRVTLAPVKHRLNKGISIHTLRMEGDAAEIPVPPVAVISIHTLRMEGDFFSSLVISRTVSFQSTPSAWRVTLNPELNVLIYVISIHTLRMEGDADLPGVYSPEAIISIHTLRMEGDLPGEPSYPGRIDFNPHPPHGG